MKMNSQMITHENVLIVHVLKNMTVYVPINHCRMNARTKSDLIYLMHFHFSISMPWLVNIN